MESRPKFRHGRIIWSYIRSTKAGNREAHPAIILNKTSDIVQPEQFDPRRNPALENGVFVVGVSTKYKNGENSFRLPFHTKGHPYTKLTRDCAAIVGWYDFVPIPDDVLAVGGDVPPELMIRINEAIKKDAKERISAELKGIAEHATTLAELLRLLP